MISYSVLALPHCTLFLANPVPRAAVYIFPHLHFPREVGSPFSKTLEKQIQPVLKTQLMDLWLPGKVDFFCAARRSSAVVHSFLFCFRQSSWQAMGSLSFYLSLYLLPFTQTLLFIFLRSPSPVLTVLIIFHSPALRPLPFPLPVGFKWLQVTFPFLS